jgi:RNA polymerase sigma-70 factor (ECF subfamily)
MRIADRHRSTILGASVHEPSTFRGGRPLLNKPTLSGRDPPWEEGPSGNGADPPPGAPVDQLFAAVTATCTGLISRIALSYEADSALRRELIQDILLAIWMALPTFRGDSTLKTFAASIAQKRCISHVAKRAREPRQVELSNDLVSGTPPPDEIALRNDQKRRLVECIQLLPIPQREAIVLCFEGFSYAEMADILGITSNAVMLRCQRAKGTLRSIMERRS